MSSKSIPQPQQPPTHKLVKNDHDLFNILYKQGNEVLDASVIDGFIKTQNISMLVESVCYVLDMCEKFKQTSASIVLARDPSLIGNRFAVKGVIDALGINQGHIDSSSEYTLTTVSLMFTYNPEALHFISLLRTSKNWTAPTFRQSFSSSPYIAFFKALQYEMPYIPASLIARLKTCKALELAFTKYTKLPQPNPKLPPNRTKSDSITTTATTATTTTTPSIETDRLDIFSTLDIHIAQVATTLAQLPAVKEHLPAHYISTSRLDQPKTILYDDDVLELPVHIVTSATEFLSYLVYSQFAGYGIDVKAFTDQISQVLQRYTALSIQSNSFESFKLLTAIDFYLEATNEDEGYLELQSSTDLDAQQKVYNLLQYGDNMINLPNKDDYNVKNHIPQSARIGNMLVEGVVLQILQKYSIIEKLGKIAQKIANLQALTPAPTDKKHQIDRLKLQAQSYYIQLQRIIRFHEGIWSLYRYDVATPSQLVMLYITALQYNDDLILNRLKTHYKLTDGDLMDYDNTMHMDNIVDPQLKAAYKIALTDDTFKKSKKTLIHEVFYTFSTYQLSRCIEYYVFTIKRKKSILDLSLPLNPLAVAVSIFDVDIAFLEFLIEKGAPFIPHSRYGDQFNIILSLFRSTYDQPEQRTIELLEWCKEYTAAKTTEKMAISMDEFFAFMAKFTRLPLQPATSVEQIESNRRDYLTSSGQKEHLFPPALPIDSAVALDLFPKSNGYRRHVLKWVWDNALARDEWRTKVLASPDVCVQALTGLLEVNDPSPLSFSQNSIEFCNFEDDILTLLKLFIVKENAQAVFKHQKFTSIIGLLINHRSTNIFTFLFNLGYVLDKQAMYLFAMSTPTFTCYNDYNVYIPTYRELVASKDEKWNKEWRGLEASKIPYLAHNAISSQQQGQRLLSEAEFVLLVQRSPKDKRPKVPKYVRQDKVEDVLAQKSKEAETIGSPESAENGETDKDDDDDFDEDWDSIDWTKLSPGESAIKAEKLKLIYRQQIDLSLELTKKTDEKMAAEYLNYDINYDQIPERRPAQCAKFRSLRRFILYTRDGLSQILASGVLADHKKEDVLAKCQVPPLQFDLLEPLCTPNLEELYPQIKSGQQMELVLSSTSKAELGKCCWTVLQYLYKTYIEKYNDGAIPFSEQSTTLSLLMLFIQHCSDAEYALYMLMTPIDGVGFVATCFQWLLYKIVVETFPTARTPFSLLGKLYFYSPNRVTSSLSAHLSISMMVEDIVRSAIDGFNRYTIANRESLQESNEEMYQKMVQSHAASYKKALRIQQATGKEPEIQPEPHSFYELFLQEFRYTLDYHGHDGHYYKSTDDPKLHHLPPTSPVVQYSPTRALNAAPSPINPATAKLTKGEYINQKYFNLMSFDNQFNPANSSSTNDGVTNQGIFVSNIAQRAIISLVCDMLYHYKLDEEIPKETQPHRDVREIAKATTLRSQFISSFSIFRRLFAYSRFINLQLAFFIAHLVPSADIFLSYDLMEMQAFFIGAGRNALFDQESMFIGQPIQYHVFPNTQPYRHAMTNIMAKLYEFNPVYALNTAQDNMKILAKSAQDGQMPTKEGDKPIADLVPQADFTKYNMGNFYTKYFNLSVADAKAPGVLKGKSNANVYQFDLLPQKNNVLSPYIIVDLDGSLSVNEEAQTMEELWRQELPSQDQFEKAQTLFFPYLVEEGRKTIYGPEPAPELIPDDFLALDKDDSAPKDAGKDGESTAPSSPGGPGNQNTHADTTPTSGGGGGGGGISSYLIPIGLTLASLAGLTAGAFFYLSNMPSAANNGGLVGASSQPQRKQRKRPQPQQPQEKTPEKKE